MLTARRECTRTTFENIYVANENLREYQSFKRQSLGEFLFFAKKWKETRSYGKVLTVFNENRLEEKFTHIIRMGLATTDF